MQAGKLDKRVTLQRLETPVDSFGQTEHTYDPAQWVDVATVWARVQPVSGREFVELRQQASEISTRITIRWRAGVDSGMQVKLGTRVFLVDSVIHTDEGQRELQLMCSERVEVASG